MVDYAMTKRFQIRKVAESLKEHSSDANALDLLTLVAARWRDRLRAWVSRKSRLTLVATQRLNVLTHPRRTTSVIAESPNGTNGFGFVILFVVTAKLAMAIESTCAFAVGTRGAFEQHEGPITLLL
ncbi:hypothetical protein Pla22_32230 [Rubripirellula amarantea]|uniref:Uncharacterized protein n=1 Tax=Rubripirellula amarantea TaxID=2527999 RepID=A0A5C5WIM7_9BACT|nr:hypothetical protein Pla22_32230 [Rubripirellula amarantea]